MTPAHHFGFGSLPDCEEQLLERDWELLLRTVGVGFATHLLVEDETGEPADFEIRNANPVFERLVDRSIGDLRGRLFGEVLAKVSSSASPFLASCLGVAAGRGRCCDAVIEVLGRPCVITGLWSRPGLFMTVLQVVSPAAPSHPLVGGRSASADVPYRLRAPIFAGVDERPRFHGDVGLSGRLEPEQGQQARTLEAGGWLSAAVAHDLNGLMSVVLLNVHLLEAASNRDGPIPRESVRDIESAAVAAAAMVKQLTGLPMHGLPIRDRDLSATSACRRRCARGGETILVVEDSIPLRRVTQRALERDGYRVVVAADGVEALQLLAAAQRPIDLVMSDVVMPRMGGPELHRALLDQPTTPAFILTSGYQKGHDGQLLDDSVAFVQKPWQVGELLALVREELDRVSVKVGS